MNIFKENESSIKNFTRGGQTFMHSFRMIQQIADRVLIAGLMVYLFCLGAWIYVATTAYTRYLIYQWAYAQFNVIFNAQAHQFVLDPQGHGGEVYSQHILQSTVITQLLQDVLAVCYQGMVAAGIATVIFLLLVYYWLRRRGAKQAETKKLRGDEIASVKTMNKLVKKKSDASFLNMAGLLAPMAYETQHILIHGTTGSGKSQLFYRLLDQIRAAGHKAVIYDKGGNYIRHFYQTGDRILNPLDERTDSWSLWQECRDSADYDSLAAALIPMPASAQDPFWVNAARTIFSAAAFEMRNDPDKSAIKLLRYLLTANLDVLQKYLKGTEAETLVSEKAEKTAISIKAVLATYLKSLKYVKDSGDSFSIRQWLQDDSQKNWLFISSLSDRHESLKPLISMWLDIAANTIMSLTENYERRIFVVLDELPSLQKLPYLTEAGAESRKFGGCLLLGMQSISQIRKIYGNNAAEELSGLCNTRVFFRTSTADTAKWVATELGEEEIEETREGISYGESAMRSGISISQQQSKRQIVHYSEILTLDNLIAFVRLPGSFPITKITMKYQRMPERQASFVRRVLDDKSIAEIDQAVTRLEKMANGNAVNVLSEADFIEDSAPFKPPVLTKRGRPKKKAQPYQELLDEASHHLDWE